MSKFHVERQHRAPFISRWLLLAIAPFVLLFISAVGVALWYQANLRPLSTSEQQIIVTVPAGASSKEIAILLEEKGVIRSQAAFEWYTRLNNYRDSMQAGGYRFSPNDSVQEIVARLISGDVASDLVIVLPAQRVDELKATFVDYGFDREEVNQAFNAKNYANHPALAYKPAEASLEGYIYPDSYQRTDQTKPSEIVTKALDELDSAITPALRQRFSEQGLSVHDAIILASIVESEVSAESGDRSTVAQVYLKRLREGIPLQADPTAQYGTLFATGTTDGWRNYDTPYNTYLHTGLPIGPISNVSASSLQAVAYPADTEYLYFVSGDDDVTHFSHTLAEHEAKAAQYCIKKCASY